MDIFENHPLAKYTTFQIGGEADYFVEVQSTEVFLRALDWAAERDLPVFVFGGGSNLLFADEGFRGLVIRVKSSGLQVDGEEIHTDAGTMMAKVVLAAAAAGLTGMEAWNGLPGTVGGAVYGNAGCFGVDCKAILTSAEVYLPGEGLRTLHAEDLAYGYRTSKLKRDGGFVLSAIFKLKHGESAAIESAMKEVARSRIQKQPPGSSTGSFFKNPPGDHAGRLIEAAGLKGKVLGKAKISDQHANFFINMGGATAAEILALASAAEEAVFNQFGVRLEREVVFVPSEGIPLNSELAPQ